MELPPHTRRTHAYNCTCSTLNGALCMRGEYMCRRSFLPRSRELAPRTWRILPEPPFDLLICGTTSAYAENTRPSVIPWGCRGNYLRVRGEYLVTPTGGAKTEELPPRAWRIRKLPGFTCGGDGTTSACAKNTALAFRPSMRRWNYLRVRGEYYKKLFTRVRNSELPPRARRILTP